MPILIVNSGVDLSENASTEFVQTRTMYRTRLTSADDQSHNQRNL